VLLSRVAFCANVSSGLYALVVASPGGLLAATLRPNGSLVHVHGVAADALTALTALAVPLAGVPASA